MISIVLFAAGRKAWQRVRARAFARDQRGVTIVEFALLAVPFFALIGAILETSVVFLASQMLDSAVQDSGRLIRTGQAQLNGYTDTNFRTAICQNLYGLFDCGKLQIKVSTVSDFSSANVISPVDVSKPDAPFTIKQTYCPGVGNSIVIVQAYYKWPVFLNFDGFNLQTASDGTHLMGAVRVFKNEPFGGTAPTC